jgi:hypothetical protein
MNFRGHSARMLNTMKGPLNFQGHSARLQHAMKGPVTAVATHHEVLRSSHSSRCLQSGCAYIFLGAVLFLFLILLQQLLLQHIVLQQLLLQHIVLQQLLLPYILFFTIFWNTFCSPGASAEHLLHDSSRSPNSLVYQVSLSLRKRLESQGPALDILISQDTQFLRYILVVLARSGYET